MQALRRFTENRGSRSVTLSADHKAVENATTLFPSTVRHPANSPRLLVSGINSKKIGSHIIKGPWKGFQIWTLTLVERETCPTSCGHWLSCYGNNMHYARRHRPDPDFLPRLEQELVQKGCRGNFAVRLHVLGDFFSTEYVAWWAAMFSKIPALHVFGFTAWEPHSPIRKAVQALNAAFPDRCAIRFSTGGEVAMGANTGTSGTICPAQTGATDCCGTCGLCWIPAFRDRAITFLPHGTHLPHPSS